MMKQDVLKRDLLEIVDRLNAGETPGDLQVEYDVTRGHWSIVMRKLGLRRKKIKYYIDEGINSED